MNTRFAATRRPSRPRSVDAPRRLAVGDAESPDKSPQIGRLSSSFRGTQDAGDVLAQVNNRMDALAASMQAVLSRLDDFSSGRDKSAVPARVCDQAADRPNLIVTDDVLPTGRPSVQEKAPVAVAGTAANLRQDVMVSGRRSLEISPDSDTIRAGAPIAKTAATAQEFLSMRPPDVFTTSRDGGDVAISNGRSPTIAAQSEEMPGVSHAHSYSPAVSNGYSGQLQVDCAERVKIVELRRFGTDKASPSRPSYGQQTGTLDAGRSSAYQNRSCAAAASAAPSRPTNCQDMGPLEVARSTANQSVADTAALSPSSYRKVPTIQEFDGKLSAMEPAEWMAVFELVTDFMSDTDRTKFLATRLKDVALSWFVQNVARRALTWAEVRALFDSHFAYATVSPVVAGVSRRLTRDDTVLAYCRDKVRLLQRAGYTMSQMLPLLTAGLPESFRPTLEEFPPPGLDEWLRRAVVLENQSRFGNSSRGRQETVSMAVTPPEYSDDVVNTLYE